MNKFVFAIVLIFAFKSVLFSCGTVQLWSEKYDTDSSYEHRIDALKFIHCDVISTAYFKNKSEQSVDKKRLILLYSDALNWSDKVDNKENQTYIRFLILKGIVVFHLFDDSSDDMQQLLDALSSLFHFEKNRFIKKLHSTEKDTELFISNKMSLSHGGYYEYLKKEIETFLSQLNNK